ncbi:DMT family transporter [Brevundimonas sp. BAL450]|jgi:bacterial/archaeal transporter family-2 protein|uniref:DMT family transporter n=1 Tax=Brevundimonas TaxID=41275 RepID=UPI0018CACFDE|nr:MULTISPECIES: DMT family transporter [Brevundimonas]MBG7615184.1 DMT family transporter [Brevundimonas sp. BAL450]
MNPTVIAILAVIVGGALTALQGPTNARLSAAVASPVNAALISFAIGTVALLALAAVLQTKPDMAATRALPPAAWLGGLYGAVFVVASAYAVPRLGVATTIVLMVAGQMMLSLILDHFGFMGVPKQPITLSRLAGVAMLIGGVLLVRRG